MARRDVVVMGGSAGSFEGLRTIISGLPKDLQAAVFIVMHLHPRSPSHFDGILKRCSALPAVAVREGMALEKGKVYVAVPDHHLVVASDHIHVTRSPKEGLHRPSINVTFRSAAATHQDRVIGVLLSGMLDDGASGLWDIARHGGVTIVQDLDEALFPSMPLSAVQDAPVNFRLRTGQIPSLVTELVAGAEVNTMPDAKNFSENFKENAPSQFSGFTCPECRGPLYMHREAPVEFRCRVGHIFPLKTLLDESTSTQERKLYEAIVALEEGADMAELAAKDKENGNGSLQGEAKQLRAHAAAIRRLIEERSAPTLD
jgi:two-component system chemotaxis response regulator CheB